MERMEGVEPSTSNLGVGALPLSYIRGRNVLNSKAAQPIVAGAS
jgi:hypothetical protein